MQGSRPARRFPGMRRPTESHRGVAWYHGERTSAVSLGGNRRDALIRKKVIAGSSSRGAAIQPQRYGLNGEKKGGKIRSWGEIAGVVGKSACHVAASWSAKKQGKETVFDAAYLGKKASTQARQVISIQFRS